MAEIVQLSCPVVPGGEEQGRHAKLEGSHLHLAASVNATPREIARVGRGAKRVSQGGVAVPATAGPPYLAEVARTDKG